MEGKKPLFGNLGGFLEKFKAFKPSDVFVKEATTEILKARIGVDILKTDIQLRNQKLYIRTTPIIKQEIFLHQEDLLSLLNERLPNVHITEIR